MWGLERFVSNFFSVYNLVERLLFPANGKVIFTLAKHGLEGILDGMTIDTNGNLWIAVFNGSCVIQIDPRKPETLLETIAMPVKQVTKNETIKLLYNN